MIITVVCFRCPPYGLIDLCNKSIMAEESNGKEAIESKYLYDGSDWKVEPRHYFLV